MEKNNLIENFRYGGFRNRVGNYVNNAKYRYKKYLHLLIKIQIHIL